MLVLHPSPHLAPLRFPPRNCFPLRPQKKSDPPAPRKPSRREAKSKNPDLRFEQIKKATALCSVEPETVADFQLRKALKPLLDLKKVKDMKVSNPVNFRSAPMVTTFVRSAGDRTRGVWKFLDTVWQTDPGIKLADLEHSSLKRCLNFCAGRVPILVHPSFYRSLKVRFPLDVLARSEFSLTWRLVRKALALNDWAYRAWLADMPDCPRCGSGLEETALLTFYYCERVHPFWSHVEEWTARISPRELVLLVVGYVVDNVDPPFQGEKRVVFLVTLAVARMEIWQTRNKGLYEGANFSYRDLILFFRHQLRVKIRCDRRRLDRITFSKRWVNVASLVVCKGATLESSFPPLPVHGDDDPGPSGPHLG